MPAAARWLLSMLGVLLVLVVGMTIVGMLQPEEHEARGSVVIHAPLTDVWSVLVDVKSHPAWRPDVKRIALGPSPDGRDHWLECDAYDACVELVTTEMDAPRRWVRVIPPGKGPFSGSWEHLLTEVDGGTSVTIIERGTVKNPFFRFVSTFMLGHTYTLQQFLSNLSQRMDSHGH